MTEEFNGRDFGQLEGLVKGMDGKVDQMLSSQTALAVRIGKLETAVSYAAGRNSVLGAIAGFLGGGIAAWFARHAPVLAAAIAIGAAVSWHAPALAHGPAEWIQNGGYRNSGGELCCGERDCFELASEDVKITSAGYYIVSLRETIPFSEAQPSPDGIYWRCQWGGARKCFFAPPPGM